MRVVVPILLLVMLGGCGKSTPPVASTVKGRVTFQGHPLAGGAIVFVPDRERGFEGKPLRADIDTDGTFQLAGGAAVTPGWYRVAIAAPPHHNTTYSAFPLKLARPDLSGQLREVKPSHNHVFEFAVEVPNG